MKKDFVENPTCTMKVNVFLNKDGNILQEDEQIAGEKTLTFNGIKSDVTIDDAMNTEDSEALHNGISALMWLFTGTDENFDPLSIRKVTTEIVEDVEDA